MNTILIIKPKVDGNREFFFDRLAAALKNRSTLDVYIIENASQLEPILDINPRICAVLYDWDHESMKLAYTAAKVNEKLPIFAFSYKRTTYDVDLKDLQLNLHFLDYVAHAEEDYAARILMAINDYYEAIMPPFTKALFNFVEKLKYPFCTPGHLAGDAFMKSPVGAVFYDFYGANTFKADVSVSMPELGSLLDHSGPHKEAEEYIAKSFNADRSYIVTNGTSTANKIVGMSIAHQGATVLIDRNCHKSLTHLLMMTDVNPIYFRPTRNRHGIIGGIPKLEFSKKAIKEKINAANKVAAKYQQKTKFMWPEYAVITNSTYDGLFYNTNYIKQTLDVKNIHFDGAWVPYTNFSPIYKGLYGMDGEPSKGKIIFETQSTHKLLAAFSQTSMIHVKGELDEERFNECYMMHTTTSPFYGIVASAEIATAMMQGNPGKRLINSSIKQALDFRKEIHKLERQNKDSWFFGCWQPNDIGDKAKCWPLKRTDKWHGFKSVDANFIHLDPIKITILTPGLKDGKLVDFGIPAAIVAAYLDFHGIVVEKTGPYCILFLFSIGVDKSKALKLLTTLLDFKRVFDANLKVETVLPIIYAEDPVFYKNMRIQELAKRIHGIYQKHNLPEIVFKAYDNLPEQHLTPYKAYQEMVKGNVKPCKLKNLKGKICAEMILPYPPGIPVILPGEVVTEKSQDILEFLLTLCEIGEYCPGFETDIHGAEKKADGEYYTRIVSKH